MGIVVSWIIFCSYCGKTITITKETSFYNDEGIEQPVGWEYLKGFRYWGESLFCNECSEKINNGTLI